MNVWNEIHKNEEFNAIDMCKFIMAFVVIAIHTNPVVNIKNQVIIQIVMIIQNFAVPFFFVASGFFLYYRQDISVKETKEHFKRYLKKIIRLYCVWTIISLPLTVYGYYISGDGILHCIFSYIKYFFFVGKLYNSYHLWYLLALIYAIVIIWVLLERNLSLETIFVIAFGFFTFSKIMLFLMDKENMLGGVLKSFSELYQFIFNKGNIFTGMIYVCIGMRIANRKKYINRVVCLCGLIVINILQIGINNIIVNDLLTIPEAALFFMFLLGIKLPEGKKYIKMRKASSIIYLSHLIFLSIYTILIIGEPNKLGPDSFVVTAILISINAILLIKISEKNRFIREIY